MERATKSREFSRLRWPFDLQNGAARPGRHYGFPPRPIGWGSIPQSRPSRGVSSRSLARGIRNQLGGVGVKEERVLQTGRLGNSRKNGSWATSCSLLASSEGTPPQPASTYWYRPLETQPAYHYTVTILLIRNTLAISPWFSTFPRTFLNRNHPTPLSSQYSVFLYKDTWNFV